MNLAETSVFALYFLFMLSIGIYFFLKSKNSGEMNTSWAGATWAPGCQRSLPALPI